MAEESGADAAMTEDERRAEADRVGHCVRCRFGRAQRSPRGDQRFWRCGRSDDDPRFPRYPRIPVLECGGFEAADAGPQPDQR